MRTKDTASPAYRGVAGDPADFVSTQEFMRMSGFSKARMHQFMDEGVLGWYTDPSNSGTRFLRSDVEKMVEHREYAEALVEWLSQGGRDSFPRREGMPERKRKGTGRGEEHAQDEG